jgi:hypothetical protein
MSDPAPVKNAVVDEILKEYSTLSLEDKATVLYLIHDARDDAWDRATDVEHEKHCDRLNCDRCQVLKGDFSLTKQLATLFDNTTEKTASDLELTAPLKRARFAAYALEKSAVPSPPSVRNYALVSFSKHLKLWADEKSRLQKDALISATSLYELIIGVMDAELERTENFIKEKVELKEEYSKLKSEKEALASQVTDLFKGLQSEILAHAPALGSFETLEECLERDAKLSVAEKQKIDAIDTYEARRDAVWNDWRNDWPYQAYDQNWEAAREDLNERFQDFDEQELIRSLEGVYLEGKKGKEKA